MTALSNRQYNIAFVVITVQKRGLQHAQMKADSKNVLQFRLEFCMRGEADIDSTAVVSERRLRNKSSYEAMSQLIMMENENNLW